MRNYHQDACHCSAYTDVGDGTETSQLEAEKEQEEAEDQKDHG